MLYKHVTVFLCLQFVNANVINYASYQNLTRIKRADECGFSCKYNVQCIRSVDVCNGIVDCQDGSDETDNCAKQLCPNNLFRCNYGACISKVAVCDGIQHCRDNSDETQPECKTTPTPVTPATNGGCVLPEHPDHGKWRLIIDQKRYPGDVVDALTIIEAHCDAGYFLVGKKFSICIKGRWEENFKCDRYCSSGESTATANITCTYRVCGQKRVKNTPLSVGGTSTEEGDYPWQVALFKKVGGEFKTICGGSVLTSKVVITVAHCMITDIEINENKSPVTADFQLAAGKYYRTYHHPNDKYTQYRFVKEILPHPDYRGVWGNYNGDLALLVVTEEFVFGPYVQPVCRDNGNILHLQSGQEGIVTGWGYIKVEGTPAEVLTQIKVPFEEDSVCKSKLPEEYVRRFYANDKLCAGFYNQSKAICNGDSGGGLVFPHNGRYYIRGLVSISPRDNNSCDIQQYTLFTKVNWYSSFIDKTILKYDGLN